MNSSITRVIRVICAGLLACCIGQSADPLTFGSGVVDLRHDFIAVPPNSAEKDVLAAKEELKNKENWTITLKEVGSIRPDDVTVDTHGGIRVYFPSGFLGVSDPEKIPSGNLSLTYRGTVISVTTGKKAHFTGTFDPRGCLEMGLTTDKKNANVDITGGFQAGVGAKPLYNWSVKANCPFSVPVLGQIGPSFTGEATQQNNADPDSLKAGITVHRLLPLNTGRVRGFILSGDALSYEFERKLKKQPVIDAGKAVDQQYIDKNANLIWTGKAAYVDGWRRLNFTLNFIGFEAGKAMSRTVKKTSQSENDQTITRLYFSFDPYYTWFFHRDKPVVIFHGSEVLRLPFHPEPYQQAGVNGGNMFLTDKPRHWSLVELTFPFAEGLGLNVQYKRGSLPPSYQFVDHQVTVGFNILLKRGG
jgi:hypothetical protein